MSRALVVLDTEFQRRRAAEWCWALKAGTRVEFKAPKRTDDQNAKMWAMLTEVATQARHHTLKLSPDDWKLLFLDALKREVRMIPNLDGNGIVSLGRSSSDLSKQEMSDLIELIFEFGARNGVVFHNPSEPPVETPIPADAGRDGSPTPPPAVSATPPSGIGCDRGDGPEQAGKWAGGRPPITPANPSASADQEGEALASETAEKPADSPPAASPSEPLPDKLWLLSVAKQLWAATGPGEQDLLGRIATDLRNAAPAEVTKAARDDATQILKKCKLVCFGEASASDTLPLLAGIVGCTEQEIVA